MLNDNTNIQDQITKTRKTFTIISIILILQGSFCWLPLLNPINPKQKQGIFKTCNFTHIYKVLFKAYLENSKHSIESLIFDSFLIINPEKNTMPDLAKALTINEHANKNDSFDLDLDINNNAKKKSDLVIYLQNLNIRLLMPIPVISAIIGAIRNVSAIFLKNLFEYNKGSDRSNPILSVTKFICGLIFIPSIMILTLCKKLIDYPNKIVMNSFNKAPLVPHKLTAFILSMASILGLHNASSEKSEKGGNNNTSIPIFLTLFTLSTVQLMAFICTIIHYATPKKSPSDIFKNYITNNNHYENLENNLKNQHEEEDEDEEELKEEKEEKVENRDDFSNIYNDDFSL